MLKKCSYLSKYLMFEIDSVPLYKIYLCYGNLYQTCTNITWQGSRKIQ